MHEEILIAQQQNTPRLSSYFELMDKVIPRVPRHAQHPEIRGTRVLLQVVLAAASPRPAGFRGERVG
jgi:hypothetical protein